MLTTSQGFKKENRYPSPKGWCSAYPAMTKGHQSLCFWVSESTTHAANRSCSFTLSYRWKLIYVIFFPPYHFILGVFKHTTKLAECSRGPPIYLAPEFPVLGCPVYALGTAFLTGLQLHLWVTWECSAWCSSLVESLDGYWSPTMPEAGIRGEQLLKSRFQKSKTKNLLYAVHVVTGELSVHAYDQ